MRRLDGFKQRLTDLEQRAVFEVQSRVSFDRYYLGDFGADEEEWTTIYTTEDYAVLQHSHTGELAGVWIDRRSEREIIADGGDLQWL